MKTRRTRRAVNRRVLIVAVVRAASSVLLILVVHACVFSSFSLSQRERVRLLQFCDEEEEEDFGCLEREPVVCEKRKPEKAREKSEDLIR